MSELLVSEETFFEKSTACKDAILAILGGIDSNALLGINDNMSEAASTLKRSYGLFYNAIRDAVRILYVDWNVIEICVTNMIVYDGYLSSMIDGDSTAANYHAIGCSNLFTNMHAYDVDLDGSEINEARLPSYSSEDNWIITYGNIDRIDNMRFALEGFIDVCDQYLNVLNDYKETGCVQGNLADAITRYLDNVHVRLIEFIKSVSQEFHDAMNQYCISYFAEFSETGYTLFKSELTSDFVTLSNIADSYSFTINAARSTIGSAIRNLRGPHMPIPYMPTLIPATYPVTLVDIINTSRDTIQSVIVLVDELEANGRALADSAEEYILGLRASLEHIRPMGGFRLLHYHSDDATDILDVPNVEDVTEIEVQEAVYNTEAEYFLSQVRDADPATLPDEIESTRVYLSTLLPEGLELSDELILNITEYYYSLIEEGWTPDQALAIVLYSITDYSDLLAEGDYDGLNESAVTTCPAPGVAGVNAANWVMEIANDPGHGYDQNTRTNGTDYDCSSLVMTAYMRLGIPGLQAWTTSGMATNLCDYGFTEVGCTGEGSICVDNLQPGDIIVRNDSSTNGHAMMYVGNGLVVHASNNMGYGVDYEAGEDTTHGGDLGDQGQERQSAVPEGGTPDLNDQSTLDMNGEIRFTELPNGQLSTADGHAPWHVYRYTGA